jgi:hypothetical protein
MNFVVTEDKMDRSQHRGWQAASIAANIAFASFALYGSAQFIKHNVFDLGPFWSLVLTQVALIPVMSGLIRDTRESLAVIFRKEA